MVPAYILDGNQVGLGIARSLRKMGIPVFHFYFRDDDYARYSNNFRKKIRVPHPENDEEACIEKLMEYGKLFGKGVLFPASDEAVVALARNRQRLAPYYYVASNNEEITRLFIDKALTYELAEKQGIPYPRVLATGSCESLPDTGAIRYPVLIKPKQSHLFVARFNAKMFVVANKEELERQCTLAREASLEVMVQEIIPGNDDQVVNYNALVLDGEFRMEFTARQIRKAPVNWGSPRLVKSAHIPEVKSLGRIILKAMEFEGYACLEFKWDSRDRMYSLIEVNGRHNLSTRLAVKCGLNFPYVHYRYLSEHLLPEPVPYSENTYWIDFTRDLTESVRSRSAEQYSWTDYLKPYFCRKVFAVFSWRDPGPFFRLWLRMLGKKALGLVRSSRENSD